MAQITSATIYDGGLNYVSFSDTDSMTDYFHGYSLNLRDTAQWMKDHGAEEISIRGNGSGLQAAFERRAKQVAKAAGYTLEEVRGNYECGGEWRRFVAKREQVAA